MVQPFLTTLMSHYVRYNLKTNCKLINAGLSKHLRVLLYSKFNELCTQLKRRFMMVSNIFDILLEYP